jgi:hypothetical protein
MEKNINKWNERERGRQTLIWWIRLLTFFLLSHFRWLRRRRWEVGFITRLFFFIQVRPQESFSEINLQLVPRCTVAIFNGHGNCGRSRCSFSKIYWRMWTITDVVLVGRVAACIPESHRFRYLSRHKRADCLSVCWFRGSKNNKCSDLVLIWLQSQCTSFLAFLQRSVNDADVIKFWFSISCYVIP